MKAVKGRTKMPSQGELRIVVLFEDELRIAAKSLHHAYELTRTDASDDDRRDAIQTALQACFAALYHAELHGNENAHLTVANKRAFDLGPRDEPGTGDRA